MIEKLKNPFLLKLFLLRQLPLAFFARLKVDQFTDDKCIVSVPFGWMTKNPFRSMYFAAQSMAAEFSTALPAVKAIEDSGKKAVLIITNLEAQFEKKAKTRISFTCEDYSNYLEAIKTLQTSDDSVSVKALTRGIDISGEQVSEFHITWTFRLK